METKFEKLEKVLSELNISDKELIDWVNNRCKIVANKVNTPNKNVTNLIPTELPLVYRHGNVLTVENGLNLSRKHELWGIQLLSGVMVALQRGPGNNVSKTSWDEVKKFASNMIFDGKAGSLPPKETLKKFWGNTEKELFQETVDVLLEHNIDTDGFFGYLWCSEEHLQTDAYLFDLANSFNDLGLKELQLSSSRIAMIFS